MKNLKIGAIIAAGIAAISTAAAVICKKVRKN